jgi:hypothetical protein
MALILAEKVDTALSDNAHLRRSLFATLREKLR